MLKLKRSFLLLLVLFLAACGTQTQVPEAALDDSTNIEIASYGGKANVHYKKYVVGHAPKGAKYKIELICKTNDKHQKVILKQTVDIHKYKGYAFSKAYYGVGGYKCVVREVGNEHKGYYVGDHVVIQVKQNGKLIGYVAKNTSSRFQTVETPKFKVGKRGTVHVYVTNKFKKVEKKTDITIVKKFFDGKNYVDVKGEAKIYLVCKVGNVYKVVAHFAANKYTEFNTQQYAGLKCYLKESFHSDSYTLEDVQISLQSGKWGDDLDTTWKKDGYVVSEYFYLPKSSLKIIIINVVKEIPEEVKKELELIIIKKFNLNADLGVKVDLDLLKLLIGAVDLDLVCDGVVVVADIDLEVESVADLEAKAKLVLDKGHKDCDIVEHFDANVGKLLSVSAQLGESSTNPVVEADDNKALLDLDLDLVEIDGKLVIIITNNIELTKKEPTPKTLVLEINKSFELVVKDELNKQIIVAPGTMVHFRLACEGVAEKTITLTQEPGGTKAMLTGTIELDRKSLKCVLHEVFPDNNYDLVAVSFGGEPATLTGNSASSGTLNLDDHDDDDTNVISIDVVNEVEVRLPAS